MISGILLLGLTMIAAGPAPETVTVTAADAVTLRDGSVVLGQVIEPAPRGMLTVLVRRAWAEAKLPDRAARWQAAEVPIVRHALKARRDRLSAWKRDRAATAKPGDRINAWIDRQVPRLADDADPPKSTLMVVQISRGEVRGVAKRPSTSNRMLRQGWLSGFKDVETMPLNTLKSALEGRGFAVGDNRKNVDPVAIDRLLPTPAETDTQWRLRRAATEVANDQGVRFIRMQSLVLPEPAPGQAPDGAAAMGAMGDLKKLLEGGDTTDPLEDRLREVAAKGDIGASVSRLDISADLSTVHVETTLWVRNPNGRWAPRGARSVTVRPDEMKPDAGAQLAEDPQVQAAFKLFESLGLGQVPEDAKRRSLSIGAATQKAIGQARAEFQEGLAALALPIDEADEEPAKPKSD